MTYVFFIFPYNAFKDIHSKNSWPNPSLNEGSFFKKITQKNRPLNSSHQRETKSSFRAKFVFDQRMSFIDIKYVI